MLWILRRNCYGISLYYFSDKGDRYYIQTRYNDSFSIAIHLIPGKLLEKLPRKARVDTEQVYRVVLTPPWAFHNTS